ncbi:cell division protein FtsQ/DivIB [Thermodesulfobacteriota bacterium]
MLDRKKIRKNNYKNSATKRRAEILQRLYTCLKLLTGSALLLFISLVFIFGYAFLTQCEYFKTEHVIVSGTKRLSEKEILNQTDIKKGMNILSINLTTARKHLLAHSWISEAEVSRELPSKIAIRIREHEPLAILDIGRRFLINTRGEIFKERLPSDPGNLPIITGLKYSDLHIPDTHTADRGGDPDSSGIGKPRSIGQRLAHNSPFEAVMDVLNLGNKSGSILPNSLIKRIQVDRDIGLTLYAAYFGPNRIRAIKLGYNDYPDKYNLLKTILFHMEKRDNFPDFDSIDLINVNRVVVNPTKVQSPGDNHKEV